ncbi:MAG: HDOD domain-containing protein [Desulfobacterales bacterium]|nr:MAG: HDOD domain-containing protein [Desulfobacterales bacterium]
MSSVHNSPPSYLEKIRMFIARMPSLSTTVTKVVETCNNPRSSPNDLNRVISLDPVLTGKVLKLVNSAYYSLREPVASTTRAIIMLGINTVKNLALSTAILEAMQGSRSFGLFSVDDFWAHSLCVGVTAKSLAAAQGVPLAAREEYFVAGLLHDLGKIPLNKQFPDEYFRALDWARTKREPLLQAENAAFGFDHCTVGRLIAEKWQLGHNLIASFAYHHQPQAAADEDRPFVALLALANLFANWSKLGASGDNFADTALANDLLEQIGCSWASLANLRDTVAEEIEKAKIFLRLSQDG